MKFQLRTASFVEVVRKNRQQLVLHGDHYLAPHVTNATQRWNFRLS